MGRTMFAAMSVLALTGCRDWREGEETVEACMQRFVLKGGAADQLENDRNQWVPSYTYDVTKVAPEQLRTVIKSVGGTGQPEAIAELEGSLSQKERDDFHDMPATEEGLLLLGGDPSLFKVRGKPGLHRDLVRQGCEGQRAGMRLISWSAARADFMKDGKLPSGPSAAVIRAAQELDRPKIKDLLP